MPDEKPPLAFLEFGSHAETIHSNLLFLKDLFRLHLFVNERILPYLATSVPLASVHPLRTEGRSSLAAAWEVRKLLLNLKPQMAFFHTAQGNLVRNLCFLLPSSLPMAGVHHNPDKLIRGRSFSQTLISRRLKHYFVLSGHVRENIQPLLPPGVRLQEFYPVHFERPEGFREVPKTKALRVGIPGSVERTRRDYDGLLQALKAKPPRRPVEFVVLGDSSRGQGPELKAQVKAAGLERLFLFFDGYLSASDMASTLASCDLLLPLLHPGMPQYGLFSKYKVSGTFNLAYGYGKPMLMHQDLARLPEFRDLSIGYELGNLVEVLDKLSEDPSRLRTAVEKVHADPRFDPVRQRPLYEAFIRGAMGSPGIRRTPSKRKGPGKDPGPGRPSGR